MPISNMTECATQQDTVGDACSNKIKTVADTAKALMLVLLAVILSLRTRRRHRRLNGRPQTVITHRQTLNNGGQYSATIQTEILSVPFKDL